MWNLKYDANDLIYKTETDLQTQKTDFWPPKERDGLGVWDQYMQTRGWIKDKVLLYSTENYIQYPVINQNGKEYENECL